MNGSSMYDFCRIFITNYLESFKLSNMKIFILLFGAIFIPTYIFSQNQDDPNYKTRKGDCQITVSSGKPIKFNVIDSKITSTKERAERILSYLAKFPNVTAGAIQFCSEYGRVEIINSDDDEIHIQVILENYGTDAKKAVSETEIEVLATVDNNKLNIAVSHPVLGFTSSRQPTLVNFRIQVPGKITYDIFGNEYHGIVGIRRITLGKFDFKGRSGEKYKGIKGYFGGLELDNVIITNDISINAEDATVTGKLIIDNSCNIKINTNSTDVKISIMPQENLGIKVNAESTSGQVWVIQEGDTPTQPTTPIRQKESLSNDFDKTLKKADIRIKSNSGNISVAAML